MYCRDCDVECSCVGIYDRQLHYECPECSLEYEESYEDVVSCPVCDSISNLLGVLGSRRHCRCRHCGAESSRSVAVVERELEEVF